jgi:diphosphoinositol-polyphosphate diphosphatase
VAAVFMVKDKDECARTYDENGFRRRAACVCIRGEYTDSADGASSSKMHKKQVLLVTGSRNPNRWIIPGGGVEPLEETQATAIRETREEAGAVGVLGRCLGTFENPDKRTRTVVYVMVVTELLDEYEDKTAMGRCRKWFGIEEAKVQLAQNKPFQKCYLDAFTDSES